MGVWLSIVLSALFGSPSRDRAPFVLSFQPAGERTESTEATAPSSLSFLQPAGQGTEWIKALAIVLLTVQAQVPA
jgi:hypothetical protein